MDMEAFKQSYCYLCSCIDCPQTEDEITNCYKKVVEDEQTEKKEA